MHHRQIAAALALVSVATFSAAYATTHEFYGRSGNGIEIDFSKLPGITAGATFGGLSLSGFNGHTALTSSELQQGSFANDGRLWVFPNPARDTAGLGDTDTEARGFQGRLDGSVVINGDTIEFAVNIRPGYTGAGPGSVGQSGERLNRGRNNPLFVAQQQHRLNYLGFVPEGGGQLAVDGNFDTRTDEAIATFQAAFIAEINTTQSNVDRIVGPNTAGWLNAANAPTWEELVDPDPQVPGTFSVSNMIGDFDILPSRDPGTGVRTGLTPQIERFGTSWAQQLWREGSAFAKAATNTTQLMNAMSTDDGYGSSFAHSTHRVGMDIDMHVASATQQFGDGIVNRAERNVIRAAVAYIDAGLSGDPNTGRLTRIISSNSDILNGIVAERPGTGTYLDPSTVHLNHLHLDIGSPIQQAGLADLPGDFDFDDQVSAFDFLVWQRGGSPNPLSSIDLNAWLANFPGTSTSAAISVPEPVAGVLCVLAAVFTCVIGRRNPGLAATSNQQ